MSEPGSSVIGQPVRRIDGPLKVTGQAPYAADYPAENLVHGVIVSSRITSGRITAIDLSAALALPGVLTVLTHENRPRIPSVRVRYKDIVSPPGKPFRPLHQRPEPARARPRVPVAMTLPGRSFRPRDRRFSPVG